MKRSAPAPAKPDAKKSANGARAKATTGGKTSPSKSVSGKSSPAVTSSSGVTSPAQLTSASPASRGLMSPGSRSLTSPSRPSKIPSLVKGKNTPTTSPPISEETSESATEQTYREEPPKDTIGKAAVRYITEDLIKKLSKEEQLINVKKVNLTLSREGGKKIRYIEHVENCRNLEVLSLSCNIIEKMEKLDRLLQLRELNLSFNHLTKLEGIDNLIQLQILNVNGNQITSIPPWVGKKLRSLQIFRIAKNKLGTLSELSKLRPLNDLSQLSISENPMSSLPHARLYTVFYLRSVGILDSQPVQAEERRLAEERFAQDEVEGLEKKLEANEVKLRQLESKLGQTESEKQNIEEQEKGGRVREKDAVDEVEKLKRELSTKDDLLRKKTAELTRACEKHYHLEQEMAFQKLDEKFDNLGKAPPLPPADDSDDDRLFDESPYIGRARFKPNQYAFETQNEAATRPIRMYSPQRGVQSATVSYNPGQSAVRSRDAGQSGTLGFPTHGTDQSASQDNPISSPMMGADSLSSTGRDLKDRHEELDRELVVKTKKIERAEDRLGNLEAILKDTEGQVSNARDELSRLSRDQVDGANEAEARKEKEKTMTEKLNVVKQLQQNTQKIEDEMRRTEEDVFDDQLELDRLKDKLQHMDAGDTLYSQVRAEVADKEAQISYNNDVYDDLQHQLDNMLVRITRETQDIRRLEGELREGQAGQNEELKTELEEIISGLQDYLHNVRKQAEDQKHDHHDLVREKEGLVRRMQDMQTDMAALESEAGDHKELQKRLAEMEDSLVDQQAKNSSLRQQLLHVASPAQEPQLEQKLDEAEDEIVLLRQTLKDLTNQAKRDLEEVSEELDVERDRRTRATDQQKQSVEEIAQKLEAIKDENESLRNQLDDHDVTMNDVIPTDQLDGKIRDMLNAMQQGQPYRPAGTEDNVGRTLTDLQRYMEDKFTDSQSEVEKVAREKQQLEAELAVLKDKVKKAEKSTTSTLVPGSVSGAGSTLVPGSVSGAGSTTTSAMPSDVQLRKMQKEIDELRVLFKVQEKKRGTIPHVRVTPRSYYSDTGGESEAGGGVLSRRSLGGRSVRSGRSGGRTGGAGGGGGVFGANDGGGYSSGGEGDGRRGHVGSHGGDYYQDPDEEEQNLLTEIAGEIIGLQEKMGDADRLTAHQLGAAFAQMQSLEEEIHRKEAEVRNEKLKRKQFEDEQLQQAADELTALQDEMDGLQRQLDHKEQEIGEENKKQTHNHQTIAAQGEEIDYLHDVLGAQKGEIKRLHDLIEKMTSQQSTPNKEYEEEMKKLKKEVSLLKTSLSQQAPLIQAMGQHPPFVPMTSSVPMSQMPIPPDQLGSLAMAMPQLTPVAMATPMTSPVRYYSTPYQGQPFVYQQPTDGDTTTGTSEQGSPPFHLPPMHHYPPSHPQQGGMMGPVQGGFPPPPHYGSVQQSRSGPPSPQKNDVTSGNKDSPLKRLLQGETGEDLTFCNVPEHHELEDYVAELQKKVREMRKELKDKDKQIIEVDAQGTRAVNLLTDELQNKHDELENLELQIERQKSSLQQLKEAERKVEREKDEALKVLQELKVENEKITRRRDFLSGRMNVEMQDRDYEYDYDPRSRQTRQNYLKEELPCLEETLAKRKAELRESDKLLKECEADLQAAKQEAAETIQRYDEARTHYDQVVRDSDELDKRARDSGLQVIRSNEEIKTLQVDIDQLQGLKTDLEQTVRDINQVITSKDEEFNSLDSLYKETATRLQRMQNDYRITEEKEHEKLENIKRAEQDVAERRGELDRLRMQIETERVEMECVDKDMGRLRTEHQFLRTTVEEKQSELRALERDLEKELTVKQREIKELRTTIDELHTQKQDLFGSLQTRRDELQKTQYDIEKEEQNLHQLNSSIGKNKAELKHVLEMLAMEQTELNRMNEQHKQKLQQLEKTQFALQEEKAELDKIQEQRKKHQIDFDHLREGLDIEKLGIERQETERRALEANINVLTKEKEILDENCNTLETKISSQKRNLLQIEDGIHANKSKLSKLESELSRSQVDMDDLRQEKASLNDDVQILTQHVTDGKSELRNLRDNIKLAEDHIHQLEQELKSKAREKETMSAESRRLDQEIHQSRAMSEEWSRQEKQKRDEMESTQRELDKVTCDCNEAKKTFHKISMELDKEEVKLNRIIGNAQLELENLKTDLALKHDQIEDDTNKLNKLKQEAEQRNLTKERVEELEKLIKEKEKELETQCEEKKQVSGALNRAYRELQTLRDGFNQERDSRKTQVKHFEDDVDDLKQQLLDTVKDLKHTKKKCTNEITDLERVAQDHCARANRLSDELNIIRQEYLIVKQQLHTQVDMLARDKRLEESLIDIKADLYDGRMSPTPEQKAKQTSAALDAEDMTSQKDQIQRHLDDLKENLALVRQAPLGVATSGADDLDPYISITEPWRKDALRNKFSQEQDFLKHQLRQQMSRHAETLQNERQKSEGTLLNLKRRLNNLEDVLSNSDLTRSRQSLLTRSPLAELNTSDIQDESRERRSPIYSPSKQSSYLYSRPARTRSYDRLAPERGPTSPNTSFYSTS